MVYESPGIDFSRQNLTSVDSALRVKNDRSCSAERVEHEEIFILLTLWVIAQVIHT